MYLKSILVLDLFLPTLEANVWNVQNLLKVLFSRQN